MNKILVKTAFLCQLSEQTEVSVSRLKKYEADMTAVTASIDSIWIGDAKTTFMINMENDLHFLTELSGHLNQIKDFIDQAAAEYEKCEEEIRVLISAES